MGSTTVTLNRITAKELVNKILDGLDTKLISLEKRLSNTETSEFITKKEVSKMLGVSMATINNWVRKGILNSTKVQSTVRFKKSEILKLLEPS